MRTFQILATTALAATAVGANRCPVECTAFDKFGAKATDASSVHHMSVTHSTIHATNAHGPATKHADCKFSLGGCTDAKLVPHKCSYNEGTQSCQCTCPQTFAPAVAAKVHFLSGVAPEECDTSSWTGVRRNMHCGSCKVLAYTKGKFYQDKSLPKNCAGYCQDKGRACVGAWEEDADTCKVQSDMTCDQVQIFFDSNGKRTGGSGDTICQCGHKLDFSATCDTSTWSGVKTIKGVKVPECGSCKVLAYTDGRHFQDKSLPKNCAGYCQDKGRACVGAWEEDSDTCKVKSDMTCDQLQGFSDSAGKWFGGSGDSICECGHMLKGALKAAPTAAPIVVKKVV